MDCNNLIHPFQNDPGVSQRQRVMDDLLAGSAQIDGRSLADLLDYFTQLSRHVNFYETDLSVSDWQPFFQKSLPFTVTAITKFESDSIDEKLAFYSQLFKKDPSSSGLQLLVHYLYYRMINPINSWQLQLQASELPVAFALEKLIRDKLQFPLKEFVKYANAAVKWYCIKPVDWQRLHQNEVWDLYASDLYQSDEGFIEKGTTRRERKVALYESIRELAPVFLDVMRVLADTAAASMEQSLVPLKSELREKHPPHLALLFAFLKLFQHLQDDLNNFTKKHLDFFYKQVLQLKPREATPDKAHIVFEIQNQLDRYLLKQGLHVKDGKDNNKAEVLFALDNEIVVNKTQVADKRTLFLNNQTVSDITYVEGVYMAPDAGKADGVDRDFKENGAQSFPTLGAKNSKYTDPEHGFIKPYPNARLGFILASPVLLLNEGKRTITISLACELKPDICDEIKISAGASSTCCEDNGEESETFIEYPAFVPSTEFYGQVAGLLNQNYYYINRDLVAQAVKKGISKSTVDKLNNLLIVQPEDREEEKKLCYCPQEEKLYEIIKHENDFKNEFSTNELTILNDIFPPRKALSTLFSGEEEWLAPNAPSTITITPPALPGDFTFNLTITSILEADKPAITFYDKERLKEDFDTIQPVVKIELEDEIKLERLIVPDPGACCLEKKPEESELEVSLYHFFRNVILNDSTIEVKVCGLKNFVVQNDESVQDVNAPVYPFGTRPDVTDFDVETISKVYCITQELIDDAVTAGISNATKNYLESVLGAKKSHRLKQNLEDFLNTIPVAADKATLQSVFNDPAKKYCILNLVGPNFYVGSKEVLCKKWNDVYVNINWKDKPVDFNEYYKAYWVDSTDFSNYGLDEENFQINIAVLDNGVWRKEKAHALSNPPPANTVLNSDTGDHNRPLFKNDDQAPFCAPANPVEQTIHISNGYFDGYDQEFMITENELKSYTVDTPFGFLRINLQNQDFLHKNYAFVLARQMMALGKFPKEFLEGATYLEAGGTVFVFESTAAKLAQLNDLIDQTRNEAIDARNSAQTLDSRITAARTPGSDEDEDITDFEFTTNPDINSPLQDTVTNTDDTFQSADDTKDKYNEIKENLSIFDLATGKLVDKLAVLIPNEPWTPIIKDISIDYTATAAKTDIDLIHLYPYDGTYKHEELESQPTLLPTFCDEGTLFLGLKDLVPGSNLNILFQLAEATADSESEREELHWFYLDNNQWKLLREGFEVLEDATDGLTASGIIKFALPANMTGDNTILPKGLHWIKAAIPQNSRSVSETVGIHTQAIRVTFTNEEANDQLRLADALPAGSIAKLKEADSSVKKVNQPYDGFGGRLPEAAGHFYVRTSELLRHKGRSIQKFDYERLVLEAFPQLFRVKCINHSFGLDAHRYFNDFPVAPGYVLLAVIPDLNQLKATASFEPRAPVSLLEKTREYLRARTSPFVRLKIMNPRYEKVHFCLKVKLYPGRDENYYKAKLIQDLREFLAPWAVGQYDKLTFGQCIYRSDIVRFLESRDYLDYLLDLRMSHENEGVPPDADTKKVSPLTPRSILIAGDIDVCIQQQDCEDWKRCKDEQGLETDCCDHRKIVLADCCDEPGKN